MVFTRVVISVLFGEVNMTAQSNSIVIYELARGKEISVPIDDETVWLSLDQMTDLFDRDKSVISRHIKNVFDEKELERDSVVAKYATTAKDGKVYKVDYYNLDVIISVGYRVKSLRGTQFRIWATKTLRQHILGGFTINKSRLITKGIDELERAVNLVRSTISKNMLRSGEAKGILKVISDYAHSWVLLHKYDENRLELQDTTKPKYTLEYEEALIAISHLSEKITAKKVVSKFFGMERDDHGLERLLGTINQTYDGQELYQSVEEKSAHLLYFMIKDHPLIDGNKRSGALLFIHYLAQNGLLFKKNGERSINDNTLVALALLIAESDPRDKDLLIKLTTNLVG